ncbi:Protein kinase, partial [Phytophthora megakarya]
FEIHRIVGQDGFGKVNAVIRKKAYPARWLAMKTISKATVISRNCVRMIWHERNLLTQIHSPLIVRMHHTFQDPYSCYVVMDLLVGGDLKYHLGSTRKDGFTARETKFYTAGILLSLEYLHGIKILHRDVKPENVILDDKGYPRLTDLGISVQTANLRFQSRSGTVVCMAPEIFLGSTEYGTLSDLFSLGVLTYELLLRPRPWDGGVRFQLEKCPNVIKDFSERVYDKYYPIKLLDSTAGLNTNLSQSCRTFLRGLLHPIELGRLGAVPNGIELQRSRTTNGYEILTGMDI